MLLSATFLTAELALLQKSLEVNLKDRRVSHHHAPPASAPGVPGSACMVHLMQNWRWRCGAAWGFNGVTPAYHSLLCPCDLGLTMCISDLPYNQLFSGSPTFLFFKVKKSVHVEARRHLFEVGFLLPPGVPGPRIIKSRLVQQEVLPTHPQPSPPHPHVSQALCLHHLSRFPTSHHSTPRHTGWWISVSLHHH